MLFLTSAFLCINKGISVRVLCFQRYKSNHEVFSGESMELWKSILIFSMLILETSYLSCFGATEHQTVEGQKRKLEETAQQLNQRRSAL